MTTQTLTSAGSPRRAWIAVTVTWVASLALLVTWLLGTPTGALREQLKVWQPWSLDLCVLLGLLVTVSVLMTAEPVVDRRDVVRMGLLAGLGVALTVLVAPRTNRIFYDEQIYQSIGQNMADLRRAQVCNDGRVEDGRLRCAAGEYNKQPYAYPHLLSVAYRVLGVHAGTAFAVNAAALALTVCGVYLLVIVLFGDRVAALFAGLLLALTPHQVVWSATAAVEPTASLASVAALLCAARYAADGRRPALAACVISAAYAIQFRPESLLVLPVVALLIWPRVRIELERPRGWWAATWFLWLTAVHVAHLYAVRHVDWGTSAARFSFGYIATNLRVNGWFYLADERFPPAFTLLAAVGLVAARRRREALVIAVYFLVFFAIDLVFYAGSYDYGADVRYSVMTYPPLAVLGGLGAAELTRAAARLAPALPARALAVTLLLFQFLWYAPVVRATPDEAWAARADVRFAETFARTLPRDAYVLTHNPGMFQLRGVNAGQMSLVAVNPAYLNVLSQRYAGGIYLHWNFWCNAHDPAQQDICRKALGSGAAEIVEQYRERDQQYAFYRMKAAT